MPKQLHRKLSCVRIACGLPIIREYYLHLILTKCRDRHGSRLGLDFTDEGAQSFCRRQRAKQIVQLSTAERGERVNGNFFHWNAGQPF
jgi:hypothetical protein